MVSTDRAGMPRGDALRIVMAKYRISVTKLSELAAAEVSPNQISTFRNCRYVSQPALEAIEGALPMEALMDYLELIYPAFSRR